MKNLIFNENQQEGRAFNRYCKEQMNPFHKTTIGKPKKWLIEAAADIGLDNSDLSHEVTNHFKEHVEKRHGQGEIRNVYVKMEPWVTYLYFDKVLNSNHNKALRACTFFKIVKPLRLFQNFSFWKSYLRFSRKTSQKAGFSKPFPKLTEFWKWLRWIWETLRE